MTKNSIVSARPSTPISKSSVASKRNESGKLENLKRLSGGRSETSRGRSRGSGERCRRSGSGRPRRREGRGLTRC